jgi:serine/threonine-protein kinase SRPK3
MSSSRSRGTKRSSPELSEEEDSIEEEEEQFSSDIEDDSGDDSEDGSNSDCEPLEDYCKGGYADLEPGTQVGRYTLEAKLGWGYFSTVWLSQRQIKNSLQPVAIKVVKSNPKYTEMADDEIQIFKRIHRVRPAGHPHLIRLLDSFSHSDRNGLHRCLVFDCQGSNLYRVIRDQYVCGLPIDPLKRIARQFYQALYFLHHNCNLIHADIKPENLLLTRDSDPNDLHTWKVTLSDLGNVDEPKNAKDNLETVQTRHYRAPEVILRHGFSYPVDMWSAACLLFELATGNLLFDPSSGDDYKKSEDHLAMMITYIGGVPLSMLNLNKNTKSRFFTSNNQLRCGRAQRGQRLETYLCENFGWEEKLARDFAAFLLTQLKWVPKERTSAERTLLHSWLTITKK